MSELRKAEGFKKKRFIHKLNGKDKLLGIDTSIINMHNNENCSYDIPNIIKQAKTKEELDKLIIRKMAYNLYNEENNKYNIDLSLLIGLNFGVYKLYSNGEFVYPELIEKILKSNPNINDTKYITDNFLDEIYLYANNNYGFDQDKTKSVINEMYKLNDDDEYSGIDPIDKFCAIDIAKIVMGTKVMYDAEKIDRNDNELRNKIRSGEIIEYFNGLNKEENKHKTM